MSNPLNWSATGGQFADISAPSTVWLNAPENGYLRRIIITLVNAITTADSIVTAKIDNVAVAGSLTIAFTASAKGTIFVWDVFVPVKKGSLIEIITDGASSTTSIAPVTAILSA